MIFFSTLMGLRSAPDYFDKFNANLVPLEKKWLTKGKAIRLVDLRKQVNLVAGDFNDDVHPGPSGYTKMVAAWLGPVAEYLSAPTRLAQAFPARGKSIHESPLWTTWSQRWLGRIDGRNIPNRKRLNEYIMITINQNQARDKYAKMGCDYSRISLAHPGRNRDSDDGK
ncbi:MAG: hypothetical protein M3Y08_18850 [Fibrobacterota bacterium]|nr:hypothetical protein [Fibrobacterota bacterium]